VQDGASLAKKNVAGKRLFGIPARGAMANLQELVLAVKRASEFTVSLPPPRSTMAAKPILDNWMLHHSEAGVRCVGAIRNHQKFPDGSFVRTSVVVARFPGGILTENGSAYMLGNKHPQNGVQSQGLYLSLPNAMKPEQEKPVPRPIAIPQKR
jgi:hypothetical protein